MWSTAFILRNAPRPWSMQPNTSPGRIRSLTRAVPYSCFMVILYHFQGEFWGLVLTAWLTRESFNAEAQRRRVRRGIYRVGRQPCRTCRTGRAGLRGLLRLRRDDWGRLWLKTLSGRLYAEPRTCRLRRRARRKPLSSRSKPFATAYNVFSHKGHRDRELTFFVCFVLFVAKSTVMLCWLAGRSGG